MPHRDDQTDELRRLEELEERARALAQDIAYQERLEVEEALGEAKDARLAAVGAEADLDAAVRGSFPASDPAAPSDDPGAAERAAGVELDEALDDSFPASDPPATTAPRG